MKNGVARAVGRLLSPSGNRSRLTVFCYHQVLEQSDPLRVGEPTAEEFKQDVETIGSVFTLLSLPDASEKLKSGELPPRAACITFDDGYENNRSLAAPILERAGAPATFFIATNEIERGVMWNDLVIEGLRARPSDPDTSSLPGFLFDESKGVALGERLQQLLEFLKYRPRPERLEMATSFYRSNAGGDLPTMMMNRDAVVDLGKRGFDIGGHTANHPILQKLEPDGARREILECQAWLRGATGTTPRSFAYPNGVPGRDFGPIHEAMVAEAGFEVAVSTEWAIAKRGANPFSLPRVGPWWRQGRSVTNGLLRSYLRSYL